MTQKDYRAIAATIARVRERVGDENGPVLELVARELSDVLAADNPRFKRHLFMRACDGAGRKDKAIDMKPVELASMRSDLIHTLRSGAEDVGRSFTDPDDDWTFVMFGMDRERNVDVVATDPALMNDDDAKDAFTHVVLPALIREHEYVVLATVVSAWMALATDDERDAGRIKLRPSERPDRMEKLIITGIDQFDSEIYTAEIKRDGVNPPTLDYWERLGGEVQGRFIDPLQDALRRQG